MKKKYILFLLLMVMTVLGTHFLIGEPVDHIQLQGQITEEGNTLSVWIAPLEENMALRGWKLRQEGENLYITVRKVPVSPLFRNNSIEKKLDITHIRTVYLGGGIIWERRAQDV